MFITLQDVNGKYLLGQDPLHYMTIVALAYDGIFRRSVKDYQIKYKDATSMYPWAMQVFEYPIKDYQIRRIDDPDFPLIPLDQLFGLQKCDLVPPTNLYHPVLPMRDPGTGN